MSEILYRKVGRKYVPYLRSFSFDEPSLHVPIGKYALIYAFAENGRSYSYQATPDTAGFIAAVHAFKHEFVDAINRRIPATPTENPAKHWTKKQKALIDKFRDDMVATGALKPIEWQYLYPDELVDEALEEMLKK